MTTDLIDSLSPLEKKRFNARKYKWLKKGLSETEAIEKSLATFLDAKEKQPSNQDEQPLTTTGNHYNLQSFGSVNWKLLCQLIIPLITLCLTTFILVIEAKNFYETSEQPFPYLWAIMVELGILTLSLYSPKVNFAKVTAPDIFKWGTTKLSLVALVWFSYHSVIGKIEIMNANDINRIYKDQTTSEAVAAARKSLKIAQNAKASAVKYGDHQASKREDLNIKRYEKFILTPPNKVSHLIEATQKNTSTLKDSRLVALLLNVIVGHLIAAFGWPFGKKD
jgi:hypothetical protein